MNAVIEYAEKISRFRYRNDSVKVVAVDFGPHPLSATIHFDNVRYSPLTVTGRFVSQLKAKRVSLSKDT